MYAAPATLDPDLLGRLWSVAQVTVIAAFAGGTAGRLLGVGVRARGLPLFSGLVGLHAGSWLWGAVGWDVGPAVAGHGVVPAFVGAFGVAGVLRLVELAVAGPRR